MGVGVLLKALNPSDFYRCIGCAQFTITTTL